MRERIVFKKDDRIAVVAPHPDDECLGAAAALILAPDRTDIYVLTDGSHGNPEKSIEEEREIRRAQFDAEMEAVKPHAWEWLGYEDTTLPKQNLEFSSLIIRRLQEDGKLPGREGGRLRVGFLTGGFHIPRASLIAEEITAEDDWEIRWFPAYGTHTRPESWFENPTGRDIILAELRKTHILKNDVRSAF